MQYRTRRLSSLAFLSHADFEVAAAKSRSFESCYIVSINPGRDQHDENDPETVWVTINYDTETHSVTYVNVSPNKQVTRIDIQCDALDGTKTSARITYTITALGEKGSDHIKQLTQEHYEHWMQHSWEKAINYYLHHGKAAPH